MWHQLVKEAKEAFCLVLNRNKELLTNWRHRSGIINKVYKMCNDNLRQFLWFLLSNQHYLLVISTICFTDKVNALKQ